jgi:hypothetical protein
MSVDCRRRGYVLIAPGFILNLLPWGGWLTSRPEAAKLLETNLEYVKDVRKKPVLRVLSYGSLSTSKNIPEIPSQCIHWIPTLHKSPDL